MSENVRKYIRNQRENHKKNDFKNYDIIKEFDPADKEWADGTEIAFCKKCGKQFKQEYIAEKNSYQSFDTCHKCRWDKAVEGKKQKELLEFQTEKTLIEKSNEASLVVDLRYNPYPWQKQFHNDMKNHRFAVMACGSRCGKDFASVNQLIFDFYMILSEQRALDKSENRLTPTFHAWLVAPTEKLAKQNWRQLKSLFPKEWVVGVSDSTFELETIYGGLIEVRSAHNPEDLVSVGLDFVIITEASRIRNLDIVWSNLEDRLNSEGRGPHGTGGRAVINGSPTGKRHHFYKMYCNGKKGHSTYDSDFVSYQLPTTANPKMALRYSTLKMGSNIHPETKKVFDGLRKQLKSKGIENVYVEQWKNFIEKNFNFPNDETKYKTYNILVKDAGLITYGEALKRRKGERRFNQDNMALFIEDGGTAFPNFIENCVTKPYMLFREEEYDKKVEYIKNFKEIKPYERYRLGYDPATGSSADLPVLVVREMSTNNIVEAVNLHGYIDEAQADQVARYYNKYNAQEICLLTLGFTLMEGMLTKRGLNVIGLSETGLNKRKYVENLQVAVSNKDVHVVEDGTENVEKLIAQMEDYTEKDGKFSNSTEANDDFVSAMYAVYYDYDGFQEIVSCYTGMMKEIKSR